MSPQKVVENEHPSELNGQKMCFENPSFQRKMGRKRVKNEGEMGFVWSPRHPKRDEKRGFSAPFLVILKT